jgi:transposase
MVYSDDTKQQIVFYFTLGLKASSIAKALGREGINVSRAGIHKLLLKYQETGSVTRCAGSGRARKIAETIRRIVEEQMWKDHETTVVKLQVVSDRGFQVSRRTIWDGAPRWDGPTVGARTASLSGKLTKASAWSTLQRI